MLSRTTGRRSSYEQYILAIAISIFAHYKFYCMSQVNVYHFLRDVSPSCVGLFLNIGFFRTVIKLRHLFVVSVIYINKN